MISLLFSLRVVPLRGEVRKQVAVLVVLGHEQVGPPLREALGLEDGGVGAVAQGVVVGGAAGVQEVDLKKNM